MLVFKGYDHVKGQFFYRPLGGGVEFGEYSRDTVLREIREELGAELRNLRFLGMLENIFLYNGEAGHEIVLVYEGELAEQNLYEREMIQASEDELGKFDAIWTPLSSFNPDTPLYPNGLLELIREKIG